MKIHYRKKKDGIEIVRCYGYPGIARIPAEIGGLPVISAAPYAFSAHLDREAEDVQVLDEGGLLGADASGKDGASRLLAGERLEGLIFPDTLREIGRYIFYGCGNLKSLEFSDSLTQIGGGAFTGCHKLSRLTIHMQKGTRSCLREILEELWQRVDVRLLYEKEARLVFPEHYDEAVENTPARILSTQYHGSGANYRQCFYDRKVNYADYDRLFPVAAAMENLEVLADLAFGRLEFPYELSEKAEERYRSYIREHLTEFGVLFVKQQDLHRLSFLSAENLWTDEALEAALDAAAASRETEISAVLMEERSKRKPKPDGGRKKKFVL